MALLQPLKKVLKYNFTVGKGAVDYIKVQVKLLLCMNTHHEDI